MHVLAFDTCFGAASAAVLRQDAAGQRLLAESYEPRTAGHAERLPAMISETMRHAGLAFADIDRIAVTVGPGSFTGVRVGIAAARALSLATGQPAVGMTSLAVMADEARRRLGDAFAGRAIVVAVDARAGMVYVQFSEDTEIGGGPQLLEPDAAAAAIGMRPVVLVGSGAPAVARSLATIGGRADVALTDLQPHARSLAERAFALNPEGVLRPLYIRPPDVRAQGDKSLPRASS